jgi:hypothetical protein
MHEIWLHKIQLHEVDNEQVFHHMELGILK